MAFQESPEGRVARARGVTIGNVYIALMDAVMRIEGSRSLTEGLPSSAVRRLHKLHQALEALRAVAKSVFTAPAAGAGLFCCPGRLSRCTVCVVLRQYIFLCQFMSADTVWILLLESC